MFSQNNAFVTYLATWSMKSATMAWNKTHSNTGGLSLWHQFHQHFSLTSYYDLIIELLIRYFVNSL